MNKEGKEKEILFNAITLNEIIEDSWKSLLVGMVNISLIILTTFSTCVISVCGISPFSAVPITQSAIFKYKLRYQSRVILIILLV